jgi:hypothetical protein
MSDELTPDNMQLRSDYEDAVRGQFCPFCLHDLYITEFCSECDTVQPKNFDEFVEKLVELRDKDMP